MVITKHFHTSSWNFFSVFSQTTSTYVHLSEWETMFRTRADHNYAYINHWTCKESTTQNKNLFWQTIPEFFSNLKIIMINNFVLWSNTNVWNIPYLIKTFLMILLEIPWGQESVLLSGLIPLRKIHRISLPCCQLLK